MHLIIHLVKLNIVIHMWLVQEFLGKKRFFTNAHYQYAYILGNIGGNFDSMFDSTRFLHVLSSQKADNDENALHFFNVISQNDTPEKRLLINRSVYLITSSDAGYNNFISTWKTVFDSIPRLVYSYTRPKNRRKYLIYQIDSQSPISKLHPIGIYHLFKSNNILINPTFSPASFADNPEIQSFISQRDISFNKQYPFFPDNWSFFRYSWEDKAKPFSLVYNGDRFVISSIGWVGLIQKNTVFKPGHTYIGLAAIHAYKESGVSFFEEILFSKGETYKMGKQLFSISLLPGQNTFAFDFTVPSSYKDFNLNLILKGGSVSFEYLFFIDTSSLPQ